MGRRSACDTIVSHIQVVGCRFGISLLNRFVCKFNKQSAYKRNLTAINYEKSLETNKGAFYNINASYHDENGEIIFCCQRVEVEKTNFNQNIEKIQQNASRELIQAELIFNIGNYEDIETYELVLKDGKISIREYALEFQLKNSKFKNTYKS